MFYQVLEERYALRHLRHIFHVHPSAALPDWQRILTRLDNSKATSVGQTFGRNIAGPKEYIFTKQNLVEPEVNELVDEWAIQDKSKSDRSDSTLSKLEENRAAMGGSPDMRLGDRLEAWASVPDRLKALATLSRRQKTVAHTKPEPQKRQGARNHESWLSSYLKG